MPKLPNWLHELAATCTEQERQSLKINAEEGKMENVNTVNDLIAALAEALNERNYETLEEASRLVDSWLMPDYEKAALITMIEAIDSAITELEEAKKDISILIAENKNT